MDEQLREELTEFINIIKQHNDHVKEREKLAGITRGGSFNQETILHICEDIDIFSYNWQQFLCEVTYMTARELIDEPFWRDQLEVSARSITRGINYCKSIVEKRDIIKQLIAVLEFYEYDLDEDTRFLYVDKDDLILLYNNIKIMAADADFVHGVISSFLTQHYKREQICYNDSGWEEIMNEYIQWAKSIVSKYKEKVVFDGSNNFIRFLHEEED